MVPHTAKQIANLLVKCFELGGKILICGCGGSAAQAQHMAAEFMGRFEYDRDPLPAIALTTDTSFLTAWSNDHEYDTVFSRQVEALGNPGDVLIVFSTSGKSQSCLGAIKIAKEKQMDIIDFPKVGTNTAKIQENQLKTAHEVCRAVERHFI